MFATELRKKLPSLERAHGACATIDSVLPHLLNVFVVVVVFVIE
jgi:hypothetical protein